MESEVQFKIIPVLHQRAEITWAVLAWQQLQVNESFTLYIKEGSFKPLKRTGMKSYSADQYHQPGPVLQGNNLDSHMQSSYYMNEKHHHYSFVPSNFYNDSSEEPRKRFCIKIFKVSKSLSF